MAKHTCASDSLRPGHLDKLVSKIHDFNPQKTNNLQETYRNAPGSHIRELNKDCMLSYREQLSKLYFEIETITEKMDSCLKMCQEHPAEISKSDAVDTRMFLNEIDVAMKESFGLFVGMSER